MTVGGKTASYDGWSGPTQTSTGVCPADGDANAVRSAAAVAPPRRARTMLTCVPSGAVPPQPWPIAPSMFGSGVITGCPLRGRWNPERLTAGGAGGRVARVLFLER